jgi:CheY-like chemotaxis protein
VRFASDGLASLAIAIRHRHGGGPRAARIRPVRQGDRALDRQGLGVRLTIAKRLIDLQGGTLTAASDGPNRRRSDRPPLAAESPGAELTAAPQASRTLRRVFIVDDNHDAAEALAALIEALGHDVRVADNGHDALSVATTWRPDVMLLDIGLPDMDGYEVARRMREIRALDHVQIVACTTTVATTTADWRRRIRRHLIKPVGIAELDTLFTA